MSPGIEPLPSFDDYVGQHNMEAKERFAPDSLMIASQRIQTVP